MNLVVLSQHFSSFPSLVYGGEEKIEQSKLETKGEEIKKEILSWFKRLPEKTELSSEQYRDTITFRLVNSEVGKEVWVEESNIEANFYKMWRDRMEKWLIEEKKYRKISSISNPFK